MSALPTRRRPPTPEEAERVRLASRASTPPALLQQLAADNSVTVRAALALNKALLPATDELLVTDADERVRCLLGAKLANLLPGLSAPQHEAARTHTHRTLMLLAHDAAQRVRAAVADALASMPQAPRSVILALAADHAACVSEPVIRMSPLLTDNDLIDLLASPAHPGVGTAVASRRGLAASVADAVAAQADSGAIRALLQNRSSQLRETTLDALLGRAADHPEWHEPLVQRPFLPARTLQALVRIVADRLLATLAERPDLPSSVLAELRARLDQTFAPAATPDEARSLDMAQRLLQFGCLTEAAVISAAEAGRAADVAAMLAVASDAGIGAVQHAIAVRSPKAIASLVWKAGWSMHAATIIQGVLADVSPTEALVPDADGDYALSVHEMSWHVEMMNEAPT